MTFRATNAFTRLFVGAPGPDAYFRALAEHLDEALLLAQPRTGLIVEVNHAATVLTGFSRPELCSLSLGEIISPGGAAVLEEIHALTPGRSRTFLDIPLQTHSGRGMVADLRVATIEETPGRPMLLVFASNAQSRLENERRSSKLPEVIQFLVSLQDIGLSPPANALEESLKLGMGILNASAAGIFTSERELVFKLTAGIGLPHDFPTELLPREATALATPMAWSTAARPDTTLSRAARAAGWGSLLAHPLTVSSSFKGVVFVGYRPGENSAAPGLLTTLAQHLSLLIRTAEREQTDLRIRESLARVQALNDAHLNHTRDTVLIVDADHRVVRVNRAGEQALGYTENEMRGSPIEDVLVSPQDHTFALQDALLNGQMSDGPEVVVHRRSGESFPAEIRVAPIFDNGAAARPTGAMLIVRDISRDKAIETRSQQLEQRALLGEVTAIFAHEVRNPLNNISAGVQLLASRLGGDHPLQDATAKILAECARLSLLMKDVLDFSKPLHLQITPNDLGAIVQRVLARWTARMTRQHIEIHCAIHPETPPALIDARSIEQVITNLVDNAIQAMPEGGTLSVSVEPMQDSPNGLSVRMRVTDTGVGMTEDVKRRIFDPFYTTKPSGTGLGLSITRHIISANNGALKVESFPGIGSTFSLTLPAVAVAKWLGG